MLPFTHRTHIFADLRYVSANSVKANLIRCVLRCIFTAILGCGHRKDAAYESGGYQPCEADPFHYDTTDADPSPNWLATIDLARLSKADAPATDAALSESTLPTTYTARNACTNVAIALSKLSRLNISRSKPCS